MINRIIYYGVPNTPELLRTHLANRCHKISSHRAKRLAALYNLMLKTPLQWTDPVNSTDIPFSFELPEYEHLGRGTARSDIQLLCEAGLVYPFKRASTPIEMALSI